MMEYYCVQEDCFSKVSEKGTFCNDCKAYMSAEEEHEVDLIET